MADAQSRAERYKNNTIKESAIYPFMKERLRVLSMAASDARAYYAKVKLESDSIRYGHAFMLFHIERNPKAAQQMLAPLVEPGMQPPVAILQATLLAENGQIKEGLQLARTTQQQFPANKGLTLELTDLYLKYQHPEAAKTFMRHELLRNPDDSDYYARLAKAYLALGEKKLAYLANGDYSMALHVFHQAMFQLTLAEKTPPKSPYYQALIAAKIKENEGLLERQKKLRKSLGIPAG
jgi:predicted Zn-dependent protease